MSVHDSLISAAVHGDVSMLVLLDLSIAFDTLDHHMLLSVLKHWFSIQDAAFAWLSCYLSDHTQAFTHAGQQTTCTH